MEKLISHKILSPQNLIGLGLVLASIVRTSVQRQNSNEMPEDFYESHDEDESLAPKRGRQHKLKSADEFFFFYVSSKERIFRVTSGSFIWCCSVYNQQNIYFMDQLYVS